jgi:hypothetical protein
LEVSWSTTLHKFQGFEAGFDEDDMFRYLLVDPGDLSWEQQTPGAQYSAISRAKTMGTFRSNDSHPKDSAIYWIGSGISKTRILEGHMKKGKRKGAPKENCVLVTKRDRWVKYLHEKQKQTPNRIFDRSEIEAMATTRYSQDELKECIADIITRPNETWKKQKQSPQYTIPRDFFGNVAT